MNKSLLYKQSWKIQIKYDENNESFLYVSRVQCLDILSATAHAYRHITEYPYSEIIGIELVSENERNK
ncbi:MAG: hypothetical protein ACTSQG_00075 [Promethearchaeota archaeon]